LINLRAPRRILAIAGLLFIGAMTLVPYRELENALAAAVLLPTLGLGLGAVPWMNALPPVHWSVWVAGAIGPAIGWPVVVGTARWKR
jgi:hypothetical protein